jgi:hypothetical protein
MTAPALALPLLSPCLLLLALLALLPWVPQGGADMPVVVQSAADAADPAERWFSNELDLPCAPGWGGFLCNEKLLPEGWVPTDLPPVNAPVRLNPVRDLPLSTLPGMRLLPHAVDSQLKHRSVLRHPDGDGPGAPQRGAAWNGASARLRLQGH